MSRGWLSQHRLALALVVKRMRASASATLMMMGVIGITLCLPAVLFVTIDNLQRLAGSFGDTPQISLFLKSDISRQETDALDKRLADHAAVTAHQFVPRAAAWQQLQQHSNLGDLAATLDENPLPDAYLVEANSREPAVMAALQQEMQAWPGVETAQLDAAWVKRLHTLLSLGYTAVAVLAALLGLALLAITGNSIRLQIATQHEEIELARLIGATDRFIRRPFLYAGSLYGLGGGIAALGMLAAMLWLFNQSVADLARQYASDFRLLMPGPDLAAMLLLIAAALGWFGAYWAVQRALARLG